MLIFAALFYIIRAASQSAHAPHNRARFNQIRTTHTRLFCDFHTAPHTHTRDRAAQIAPQTLSAIGDLARSVGFKGIALNAENEMLLSTKDGQYLPIKDGFFESIGDELMAVKNEIGAGIAGAIIGGAIGGAARGAMRGGNPYSTIGGAIIGGGSPILGAMVGSAGGTFLGSLLDSYQNAADIGVEADFNEALSRAAQNATLDLIANKAIDKGAEFIANNGLKNTYNKSKELAQNALNLANKAPILSTLIKAPKTIAEGGLNNAEILVKKATSAEKQVELAELEKEIGGGLQIGAAQNTSAKLSDGLNTFAQKIAAQKGADSIESKAANHLASIFKIGDLRERQNALLRAIRADENGTLTTYFTSAANSNAEANQLARQMLNSTTQNLQKELNSAFGLNNLQIKNILDKFENDTKANFNDLIENKLLSNYPKELYSANISESGLNKFIDSMLQSGADLSAPPAARFIEYLKRNVYGSNVSLEQLKNARINLNAELKTAFSEQPSAKSHAQKLLYDQIFNDIDKGVDSIFAQSPETAAQMKSLYNSAWSDYKKLKEVQKLTKKLKDPKISAEAASEQWLKIAQGQGANSQSTAPLSLSAKADNLRDYRVKPDNDKRSVDSIDSIKNADLNSIEKQAAPTNEAQKENAPLFIAENKELKTNKARREHLKENLQRLKGQTIANENDQRAAYISKTTIEKLGSLTALKKSLNNGFTSAEHFGAAENIDKLFQKAIFKESHADRKGAANISAIHRYIAAIETNSNKNAQALITLKEIKENGNKIYSLELELRPASAENPSALKTDTKTELKSADKGSEAPTAPNADSAENISQSSAKSQAQSDKIAQELKEKFANAKNDKEKVEIIKQEYNKIIGKLEKEVKEIDEIIENNDFFDYELEAIKEKYKLTKKEAIEYYARRDLIQEKKEPLVKKIDSMQKELKRLEFDLIVKYNKAYKGMRADGNIKRLEKNIDRIEKRLLKDEIEAQGINDLTYNLSTKDGENAVRELFMSNKPDDEQKELFEKVLKTAQYLGVEFRHALRDPYQKGLDTKEVAGWYLVRENSARVKHGGYIEKSQKGKTLLHELIHSTTTRAMILVERNQAENILNKAQIKAIKEIESIYKEVKDLAKNNKGDFSADYGLTNTHEFLAELSNPIFREKLKKVNLFERIINAIAEFFADIFAPNRAADSIEKSAKDGFAKDGFESVGNAYERTKKALYEIIDNYNPNFTKDYEALNLRGGTLNSQELEINYLKDNGSINKEALLKNAENLPKRLNLNQYINLFKNNENIKFNGFKNEAEIKTKAGIIKANPYKSFFHLTKDGDSMGRFGNKKQERTKLNAGLIPTLLEPQFITKDKDGTAYFFKAFKDKKRGVLLLALAANEKGELIYKTAYEPSNKRLLDRIKDDELIYHAY